MVLRLRIPAPDWHDAKCLGLVQDWRDDAFYKLSLSDLTEEERAQVVIVDEQDEAMAFCNGEADGKVCPIRHECLKHALTNNLKEGIWGGMSEAGRKALRKKWPLKGNQPRPEWKWHSDKEALELVSRKKLEEDNEG